MQEKLAEAVLMESRYSSGPELSDTSTEDEYTHKGLKEGNKGTRFYFLFVAHILLKINYVGMFSLFLQIQFQRNL